MTVLLRLLATVRNARRQIALTDVARSILAPHGGAGPDLFGCESDPTRPIPKINNAHDRAVRDSKVDPFRIYDLRYLWATRAAMSGIDLVTLAAMLGHSRIQMVLRYAHPTQQHQAQAMQRLERFVAEQRIAVAEQNSVASSHVIQVRRKVKRGSRYSFSLQCPMLPSLIYS